jgi:hypothetical protein
MSSLTISSRTHQWAHLAVILFHIIMASAWLFCTWFLENERSSSHHRAIYILSYVLAALLLAISLLSITPIIKKWNTHTVITPDPKPKPSPPENDSDSETDEEDDEEEEEEEDDM